MRGLDELLGHGALDAGQAGLEVHGERVSAAVEGPIETLAPIAESATVILRWRATPSRAEWKQAA